MYFSTSSVNLVELYTKLPQPIYPCIKEGRKSEGDVKSGMSAKSNIIGVFGQLFGP
jgi:hypothetical protein